MTTHEEIQSAHKKALKSLDGEKRAAIKKAKALKGKKGKDALAALEDDFATKLKTLESNLEKDLAALEMVDTDQKGDDGGHDNNGENSGQSEAKADDSEPVSETAAPLQVFDEEAVARERKLAKSRKKRENQRKKEAEMEQKIAEETANAGPSMRDIELGQIQAVLSPLNLAISEVKADGHCLYRSVAAQLTTIAPDSNQLDYSNIRALCADTLQAHQEEFAPFCEYDGQITNFDQYVDKVRNTAEWGGHLELRALHMALGRPIHVYSVQNGARPLEIHDDNDKSGSSSVSDKEPIRLSYHLHYYALGEHYNQVIQTR